MFYILKMLASLPSIEYATNTAMAAPIKPPQNIPAKSFSIFPILLFFVNKGMHFPQHKNIKAFYLQRKTVSLPKDNGNDNKRVVSWHDMIVSRHETVVSSHDTVISNNTTMAEYIKRDAGYEWQRREKGILSGAFL